MGVGRRFASRVKPTAAQHHATLVRSPALPPPRRIKHVARDLHRGIGATGATVDRIEVEHGAIEQHHGTVDRQWHNAARHHIEILREIIGRGSPEVGAPDAEGIGDLLVIGAIAAAHRRDGVVAVRQAEREALHHGIRVERQIGFRRFERGGRRVRVQLKGHVVVGQELLNGGAHGHLLVVLIIRAVCNTRWRND